MPTNVSSIVKKELKSYFNSPIAYVVVSAFLLFTSIWLFYLQSFFANNTASLRIYFAVIPTVFIILLPALTMRSWAEEKKLGTIELLMTLPYREEQLVIGKFLSTFVLLLIMIILTLPIPIMLSALGDFDWGQIAGEYLGVLLIGAAGIAIGLFMSSIATNQISAFVVTLLILLLLTLINAVNSIASIPLWMTSVFNYLSLGYHFESFRKGLIDTRDLIYYLLITGLFLYINVKVLIFRKWM
ncbi:MAG: ABC transporter permease subunit [Spirochaetales bacterium]|nr:ABC transporter permease subunit [Spirochaetales bacterium]